MPVLDIVNVYRFPYNLCTYGAKVELFKYDYVVHQIVAYLITL